MSDVPHSIIIWRSRCSTGREPPVSWFVSGESDEGWSFIIPPAPSVTRISLIPPISVPLWQRRVKNWPPEKLNILYFSHESMKILNDSLQLTLRWVCSRVWHGRVWDPELGTRGRLLQVLPQPQEGKYLDYQESAIKPQNEHRHTKAMRSHLRCFPNQHPEISFSRINNLMGLHMSVCRVLLTQEKHEEKEHPPTQSETGSLIRAHQQCHTNTSINMSRASLHLPRRHSHQTEYF